MLSLLSHHNVLYAKDFLTNSPNFLNVKYDKDLNLYIAKHCHKSNTTEQLVRECDGTIFDADGNIVCYSGEFSEIYSYYEIQNNDNRDVQDTISDLKSQEVLEFLDGTCIRVYFYGGQWRIATRGHTDASKAKWSSEKSFKTLFDEVVTKQPGFSYDNLNKGYTYVFLLHHTENKIVCPITSNEVYLLEVYDNSTLSRIDILVDGILSPKVLNITNMNDLTVFLELNDETTKGVYIRNSSGHRMFILNKLYEERQKLKGNTLDMNKRYLELRSSNRHFDFLQQFPEYSDIVSELEKNINDNIRHIHVLYMAKHVRKENVQITVNDKKYLFPIHGYYLRSHQKITPNVVADCMFLIDTNFGITNFNNQIK